LVGGARGLPLLRLWRRRQRPPVLIPRWLARRLARKETDYATVRFLASVVAFPLFWALETWMVGRLTGATGAAVFALSLPLTGLLAYRYLVGAGRLRSRLRFGVLAFTREQDVRCLVAEREAIIAELERDHVARYIGGPLEIVLRAGRDVAEDELLRHSTAEQHVESIQELGARHEVSVLGRLLLRVPERGHAARNHGDLRNPVRVLARLRD